MTSKKNSLKTAQYQKLLPDDVEKISIHRKAAMSLHTALLGKFFKKLPNDARIWEVYVAYFRWDRRSQIAVSLLLFVSLFEVPLWCNETGFWSRMPSIERCAVPHKAVGDPNHPRYSTDPLLMSGMPLLPIGYGMIIEVILFAVIFMRLRFLRKLDSMFNAEDLKANFSDNVRRQTIACMLGLADIVFYLVTGGSSTFRLAPVARMSMASLMIPMVRRSMQIFFRILFSLKQMVAFVLGTAAIFAWATTMVFDDFKEDDVYGDPVNTDIDTFGHSLYTAFVTVTTANLPDALVFTYTFNRAFIWIWLPFIFLAACVFIQVVLAVVYNGYQDNLKEDMLSTVKGREGAIKRANRYLKAGEDQVTKENFKGLIEALQPLISVNPYLVDVIFEGIDDDNSGKLSDKEFKDVCDVIQMQYFLTKRDSVFKPMMPKCIKGMMVNGKDEQPNNLGYEYRFEDSPFAYGMDIVLRVNVFFMLVESLFDFYPLLGFRKGKEPQCFQSIDLFFSFVYILEVVMKLCIWSWQEYWTSYDNRFDFISTAALASSGTLFLTKHIDHDTLRYVNLLRILRLLKMLANTDSFSGVMRTIVKMLQTCKDVLIMNILVIYLFSAIGQQLFGGEFYVSNPRLAETTDDVAGLDYFDSHFQVFNYNDMFQGFISLFLWMLTDWFDQIAVVSIALHPAYTPGWFAANAFNLSFYLCSVLLAYNVFAAFSIDVYCQLNELSEGDGDGDETGLEKNLSDIEERLWAEGKQLHVIMSPEVEKMRVYAAMLLDGDDGDENGESGEKKDDDK